MSPWLRDMLRVQYRIPRPSRLPLSEFADLLAGMMARITAESRAADARDATLAWQIVSAVQAMFSGKGAPSGPDQDQYLEGMGLHRAASPRLRIRQDREHASRTARRFDRLRARGVDLLDPTLVDRVRKPG